MWNMRKYKRYSQCLAVVGNLSFTMGFFLLILCAKSQNDRKSNCHSRMYSIASSIGQEMIKSTFGFYMSRRTKRGSERVEKIYTNKYKQGVNCFLQKRPMVSCFDLSYVRHYRQSTQNYLLSNTHPVLFCIASHKD